VITVRRPGTTVDSFALHQNTVAWLDGTTGLELIGGGEPPNGSMAQVGVIDRHQVLVTLKTHPEPGTVDVVPLHDGAVSGAPPVAVSAPAGTLTPFGCSVYPDGTAVITLAHSNQDGLFRDGAFTSVVGAGQAADCWATGWGSTCSPPTLAARPSAGWLAQGTICSWTAQWLQASLPEAHRPTSMRTRASLV
jgi:hypothetical protein